MWVGPIGIKKIGTSHLLSGKSCEDSFYVANSQDGLWKVLVVSDGAGSAKKAIEGSEFVSKRICSCLYHVSEMLKNQPPGAWINDEIIAEIVFIRQSLRDQSKSDNISDYHATLVAALIGPHGGVSLHIGDGIIIGGRTKLKSPSELILNDQFFYSEPENGEYANETFFITEKDWVRHLRIKTFPKLDWLLVASDGGASYFQNGNLTFNNSNIEKLFKQINLDDHNNKQAYLEDFINDPLYEDITSDDKTVLLTFDSNIFIEKIDSFIFEEKSVNQIQAPMAADNFLSSNSTKPNENYQFKWIESLFNSKDKEVVVSIGILIFIFVISAFCAVLYLLYGMNDHSPASITKTHNVEHEVAKPQSNVNIEHSETARPNIIGSEDVSSKSNAGSPNGGAEISIGAEGFKESVNPDLTKKYDTQGDH